MRNRFLCRENKGTDENGTIEILRCFGTGGRMELPGKVKGRSVTALGDYLFSKDMRETPEGFLWQEQSDDDIFDRPDEQPPVYCGDLVEEIVIPPSVEMIGKYAFYNCDSLKRLHFTATISDIGAGAFNGCRKITDLYVQVVNGEKSCLKEILAELSETLTVHYCLVERLAGGGFKPMGEARLLFPVFYEEAVENTPARMLETHTHGCGHRYRYCFKGTQFQFKEYDSLLPHAKAQEPPAHVVELAVGRLRYPMELTREARYLYREYIVAEIEAAAIYLTEKNDIKEWKWMEDSFSPDVRTEFEHAFSGCLGNEDPEMRAHEEFYNIKEPVLGETGFDKLIEVSGRYGCTEALSLLMDAKYRAFPIKKKKYEL